MLQIRIHHHHKVPGGVLEAGVHGGFLAEVPGKGEIMHPLVFPAHLPQDRQGLVPGPVIDEYIGKAVISQGGEDFLAFFQKGAQHLRFIVAGNHDIDRMHS